MWPLVALALLVSPEVAGRNLWQEVNAWKVGDPIPVELTTIPSCGGDCGLEPDLALRLVGNTSNFALIRQLVVGKAATPLIFGAALERLLEADGFVEVKQFLLNNPAVREEHLELKQLLTHPVAQINVAQIHLSDLPGAEAREILLKLEGRLKSGMKWKAAYVETADEHPDNRLGREGTTFLSYKYSGWITDHRMDVGNQFEAAFLPKVHLDRVFQEKGGILILEGNDGLYLYQTVGFFRPEI